MLWNLAKTVQDRRFTVFWHWPRSRLKKTESFQSNNQSQKKALVNRVRSNTSRPNTSRQAIISGAKRWTFVTCWSVIVCNHLNTPHRGNQSRWDMFLWSRSALVEVLCRFLALQVRRDTSWWCTDRFTPSCLMLCCDKTPSLQPCSISMFTWYTNLVCL